jgi:hypothetical protein
LLYQTRVYTIKLLLSHFNTEADQIKNEKHKTESDVNKHLHN